MAFIISNLFSLIFRRPKYAENNQEKDAVDRSHIHTIENHEDDVYEHSAEAVALTEPTESTQNKKKWNNELNDKILTEASNKHFEQKQENNISSEDNLKDNESSEASTTNSEPTKDNYRQSEYNNLKDDALPEASTTNSEPTQDKNIPSEGNDLKDNELSEASTAKSEPTKYKNIPSEDNELEDNELSEASTENSEPTQDNSIRREDNELEDNALSEASTTNSEPTKDNYIQREYNNLKDDALPEASTTNSEPTQDNNMPNEDNDLKVNEMSEVSTATCEPTQDNNIPILDNELEDNVLPEALTAKSEPTQDNNIPIEDNGLKDNELSEASTAKSEPTQDNNIPIEDNELEDNILPEALTAKSEPKQDNNMPNEDNDLKDNELSEASTAKREPTQDNNTPSEENDSKDNVLSEASTAKREPKQVSSISSGDNHYEDFSSARNIDIEPKNQDQDDTEDNAQIAQHETHKKDDAFVGDEDLYFDCPEIIPLNEQNSSSGDMNKNKISEYTDSEVFSTNNDADEKDLLVKIYEEVTDLSKNVAKIVENSELQPSMPVNESSVNQSMGNNIFVAGNTTYVSGEGQQQQTSPFCDPVVSSSAPSINLTINAIGSGSRESGGLRPYELPSHEACSSPVGIQTVTQTYVASPSTPGDSSLIPLEDNEVVDKSRRTEAEQVDNTFVCSVLRLGPEDCFKLDESESVIVILDTSTKMASMVPVKADWLGHKEY
uniref:Uncharacterized protein n=1 Tax=Biomphalaria glabrata TaxID=6526 RepID=A0A2C9LPK1_BIOGL